MRVGAIYLEDKFESDCFVKVAETTLTGNATSISITGLDRDVEAEYYLTYYGVDSGGSGGSHVLRLGGTGLASAPASYSYQRYSADDTTPGAANGTGSYIIIGSTNTDGYVTMAEAWIYASNTAKGTYIKVNYIGDVNLDSSGSLGFYSYVWNSTANFTQLEISPQANNLGSNSYVALYAKKVKS